MQCPVKFPTWSNTSYRLQLPEGLLKLKKYFQKVHKLWSDLILTFHKEMN